MLRATEYFIKSLEVIRSWDQNNAPLNRAWIPISTPLKFETMYPLLYCAMYLAPFPRYSTSNNGVNLKSGLQVTQGH